MQRCMASPPPLAHHHHFFFRPLRPLLQELQLPRPGPVHPPTASTARPPLRRRSITTYRGHAPRNVLSILCPPPPSPPPSPPFGISRSFTTPKRRKKVRWLEVLKYLAMFYGMLGCGLGIAFLIDTEAREWRYPTPREWGFTTRLYLRNAKDGADNSVSQAIDWVVIAEKCRVVVRRLEDPTVEGAGIRPARRRRIADMLRIMGEEASAAGMPDDDGHDDHDHDGHDDRRWGRNVSNKSENWRRGYYEALMLQAKAVEQLAGAMVDRTTGAILPGSFVIGPSFPNPKPLPPGIKTALREENCDPAYESAQTYYARILSVEGFTPRQKMEAALACASYLEYKGLLPGAERMHRLAIVTALGDPSDPGYRRPFEPSGGSSSFVLDNSVGPPSANLIEALTGYATFKAATGDLSGALPMFVSLLRARRSLSRHTPTSSLVYGASSRPEPKRRGGWFGTIVNLISESAYPPPPPDGMQPPSRGTRGLCEEAALALYIGEIFFATGRREEGLAWTREGVDVSEMELRSIHDGDFDDGGREGGEGEGEGENEREAAGAMSSAASLATKKCRECLGTGLATWARMASILTKEEKEQARSAAAAAAAVAATSFWRTGAAAAKSATSVSQSGRWTEEEKVVDERQRRARDLLKEDEKKPGPTAFLLVEA